jgi:hypothetical protein
VSERDALPPKKSVYFFILADAVKTTRFFYNFLRLFSQRLTGIGFNPRLHYNPKAQFEHKN